MQPGSGGGNGPSRAGGGGGLTRFRSAPATWLEALLESEDEADGVLDGPVVASPANRPPLHPPVALSSHTHTQSTEPSSASGRFAADRGLLDSVGSGSGGGGLTGLLRQNSSPAQFLSDGYFTDFGIPSNYNYLASSSPLDVSESPSKRPREEDSNNSPATASSQRVKGEESGQLLGRKDGLLDAELDNLSEDSVLCRVRAKRGCATHPRSIAERVRRTRISDRIRKLQELVPNMDKQTNTADMLEEAVKYVKFLQKQIQKAKSVSGTDGAAKEMQMFSARVIGRRKLLPCPHILLAIIVAFSPRGSSLICGSGTFTPPQIILHL